MKIIVPTRTLLSFMHPRALLAEDGLIEILQFAQVYTSIKNLTFEQLFDILDYVMMSLVRQHLQLSNQGMLSTLQVLSQQATNINGDDETRSPEVARLFEAWLDSVAYPLLGKELEIEVPPPGTFTLPDIDPGVHQLLRQHGLPVSQVELEEEAPGVIKIHVKGPPNLWENAPQEPETPPDPDPIRLVPRLPKGYPLMLPDKGTLH